MLMYCEYDTKDTRVLSLLSENRLETALENCFAKLKFSLETLAEASKTIAKSIFFSHFSIIPVQKEEHFFQEADP